MDLQRALGVTRVARVTGLDRTGVEVACAIRPGGHLLQVCNGKGASFEEAAGGALGETAELWAAERVPGDLLWGTREELPTAWDAADLGMALVAPRLWGPAVRCAWRRATDLHSGAPVLVPAVAVHCPPQAGPLLGPAVVRWTSNGSGAHASRAAALLHALLEAAERDQLARALPRGWTPAAVRQRKIDPGSLAGEVARLVERLEARGFSVHLFDLSGALRLPVAAALLADREGGPIPLAAGYACAPRPGEAALAALREAAQSRLTDVHGAREDVVPADPSSMRSLRRACERARGKRRLSDMPVVAGGVREVLQRFLRAGFTRAAAVDLAPGALEVHVVKVVVPGFLVSELL